MTKLYEITDNIRELKQLQEQEEIDEQVLNDTMEGLQLAFEDKAEAITKILKNISMPITAIDEEIKRLQNRKKTIQNNVERLKTYLKNNMEAAKIDSIKTDLITIRLQNSPPSVDILSPSDVPDEYKKTKIIQEIDKKKLISELKKGKFISGAKLKQNKHIRFY